MFSSGGERDHFRAEAFHATEGVALSVAHVRREEAGFTACGTGCAECAQDKRGAIASAKLLVRYLE
jgi:hypothetical protein